MNTPVLTSAEAMRDYFPGERIAGADWPDLLVEIFARPHQELTMMVPAVPEPQIVWLLEGRVDLEERELDGDWNRVQVEPGDLFLTASSAPYEVRWKAVGPAPIRVMQVFVGLPVLAEASHDVLGSDAEIPVLREFSGQRDATMLALLEELRLELLERQASSLFVRSIARALAVHLVRTYGEPDQARIQRRAGLNVFQFNKVKQFLEGHLDESIHLADLAREAGMSEFHFSRVFKKTTGLAPSKYLIRLRMGKARRLLRETDKSVLDVSLDVGYSSQSHFADVFRSETGLTPTEYRSKI